MSTEWLPIESAPKDGSLIILGWFLEGGGGGEPEMARWHDIHNKWCGRVLLNADGHFSPTHWQPMPDLPRWNGSEWEFKPRTLSKETKGSARERAFELSRQLADGSAWDRRDEWRTV